MGNSSSILSSYRTKLGKDGKRLLDEHVKNCSHLSESERYESVREKIEQLLKTNALPPIRLIKLDAFVQLGSIPRFPENEDITCTLDSINRDESLIIFISHNWLRGREGSEGWDGKPHPDTVNGDKFKLCKQGLESIRITMAPGMKECYVWMDYGCLNQNMDPVSELEQLDKIIECSDAIFTPVVDSNPYWVYPQSDFDVFRDYEAKSWYEGPHAYVNRGWCRLEMFYAANIALIDDTAIVKRHTLFADILQVHHMESFRPHFVYGTKELNEKRPPLVLNPLQHTHLTNYHPAKGYFSKDSDKQLIAQLMEDLKPYLLKRTPVGYVGTRNGEGQRHGYGIHTYEDGSVYDGGFLNGHRHGHGIHTFADGDVYDGEFLLNLKHGHGVYKFADGCVYEGEWKDGKKHGQGTYRYNNGDVYEGGWLNDLKHGKGCYTSKDGTKFEGEYRRGKKHGQGKITKPSGSSGAAAAAAGASGVSTKSGKFGAGSGKFGLSSTKEDQGGIILGYWEEGEMVKVNRSCCFWK